MDPNYPPNPGYYPPASALPNSTMAMVSLIFSILGFTLIPFLGSIIAIITGMMARKETRGNPPSHSGDGLATAGIILGWIGVGLGVLSLVCIACSFAFPFLMLLASGGGG